MIATDVKLEILVDGKSVYNGSEVEYTNEPDKLTLSTEIGANRRQKLKLIITKLNYVNHNEDSNKSK
jgi:hypothetical protein